MYSLFEKKLGLFGEFCEIAILRCVKTKCQTFIEQFQLVFGDQILRFGSRIGTGMS